MKGRAILIASLLTGLLGCRPLRAPELPPLVEVGPTGRAQGPVGLAQRTLTALYVTARPRPGIAPESGRLSARQDRPEASPVDLQARGLFEGT